jgi:hypothetical protein
MAAAAAAMHAAFARIGFTDDTATNVVDVQGYAMPGDTCHLSDREVSDLCKSIRRPCGVNTGGQVVLGQQVSTRAETNLKLCVFWLNYCHNTSRDTAPADITMDAISAVRTLRDSHLQHKDVDPPANIINTKDWSKIMEQIVEYLRDNHSLHGIPLSYMVQTDLLEVADDPPDGWPNHLDEMIARALTEDNQGVRNQDFLEDNNKVWDLIKKITYNHDCWMYVTVGLT